MILDNGLETGVEFESLTSSPLPHWVRGDHHKFTNSDKKNDRRNYVYLHTRNINFAVVVDGEPKKIDHFE